MKSAEQNATAEVFENGDHQAVNLPDEFRFEGSTVSIRREGSRVVLEPIPKMGKAVSREEIHEVFRRMDALNAGPAIPGGRGQG